jgi:rhodanese-related sulfurtransferase
MQEMLITLIAIGVVVPGIAYWIKREMDRRELEQYSVTPEVLHAMLASNPGMLLFDVRLPLDLLVDSEIIPGARRVPPQEIIKNPSIIPQDREVIVYCTCPSDKTSQRILRKAQAMQLSRVKFLKGGLEAWKAKGFPVEPYNESFHLETGS